VKGQVGLLDTRDWLKPTDTVNLGCISSKWWGMIMSRDRNLATEA